MLVTGWTSQHVARQFLSLPGFVFSAWSMCSKSKSSQPVTSTHLPLMFVLRASVVQSSPACFRRKRVAG